MKYILSLFLFASSQAWAAVSFDIQAEVLKNSGGSPIPTSGLVLLVASTTNASFGDVAVNASLALGSLLDGAGGDDVLLKSWNLSNSGKAGAFADITGSLDFSSYSGWGAGDPLALYWFPTLTMSSLTAPLGTSYGKFTTSTPLDGSGAWVTPADLTSDYPLYLFTTEASTFPATPPGSNAPSSATASNTIAAVPEPSRVLFLTFGAIGLLMRRRRA